MALEAQLGVGQRVVAGCAAMARVTILNRGTEALLVSRRLNLMEDDLHFLLTLPSGEQRRLPGWQRDTGIDRVPLPPGHELVGTANLLDTGGATRLDAPGGYRLAAEYFPGPAMASIVSAEIALEVVAPADAAEKSIAAQLDDPAARRALIFAEADAAPAALKALAQGFPGAAEAMLARLTLSGGTRDDADWARDEAAWGTIALAEWVLCLATPVSATGRRLADSLAGYFKRGPGQGADGAARRRGLLLLLREPLVPDSS